MAPGKLHPNKVILQTYVQSRSVFFFEVVYMFVKKHNLTNYDRCNMM